MTTTTTKTTEPKMVSNLIKTASDKPIVQSSFSLVVGTYSTVSKFMKPVCPEAVISRWEAAENYVVDNQDYVVEKADEYANVASKFVGDVKEARSKQQATDFILAAVEDLVQADKAVDDEESATTTARVYAITGAVSKTAYKKATSGLDNLKERTNEVVHVDLMNYANTFIDNSVKPKYEYVTGLPTTVADKFNTYTEPVKAKALAGFDTVNVTVQDTLITPAKNAYEMKTKDGKTAGEVVVYLKNSARISWNDKFVVPVAAYLDVPNLNYSTLKPLATEFGNKKYTAIIEYGNEKKTDATDYVVAKYTTAKDSALKLANTLTTTPIADLKYSEIPASVYTKLSGEFADRFATYTGKEFSVKTAPVVVYDIASAQATVYMLYAIDRVTPYLPESVVKMVKADKVKAE